MSGGERETLELDVLFVGGGPAGLAGALRLRQLMDAHNRSGAPPVELAKANQGHTLTNSWGRWAPFAQTIGTANEPMYWVTVSSTRNFGVRLVGTNRPQIWMTPFFPTKAQAAADPSNSAFRLPFQNIDSNNHIAQRTEQIVNPL